MAIAAIVVGFLVSLVGGPSLLDHLSKTQVEYLQQSEEVQHAQLPPEQQGPLAPEQDVKPMSVSVAKDSCNS
ncbi:hypothetical protein [Paraburkholderia dipogonis]|uniref:hypothetical protein n=1 Tax=Paraburkholderia dipogonis TaxID=1211383 RepID=UPI0038BD44FA